VFRVALSNSHLEQIAEGQVTFRYRDNRTHELRRVTLPGIEFLPRFLQHVLPRGCTKVRYYGLWSPTCRKQLEHVHTLLTAAPVRASDDPAPLTGPDVTRPSRPLRCPHCQGGTLLVVAILPPHRSRSP
jgi:hypothetical protein